MTSRRPIPSGAQISPLHSNLYVQQDLHLHFFQISLVQNQRTRIALPTNQRGFTIIGTPLILFHVVCLHSSGSSMDWQKIRWIERGHNRRARVDPPVRLPFSSLSSYTASNVTCKQRQPAHGILYSFQRIVSLPRSSEGYITKRWDHQIYTRPRFVIVIIYAIWKPI